MSEKSGVVDAEFELIEDRWRLRIGDAFFYAVWVGGYAWTAYELNDRALTPILVCAAGLAWPVRRWLGTLRQKVSGEQEALLRDRISARQSWRRRALPRR